MTKLLAFTDLHIKAEGETIIGLDPYQKFADAFAHAVRRHPDADHVVLMGDLVNSGKPEEYARVAAAIADSPFPVTLMPGNHDDREAMADALGAHRDGDGYIQTVIETPTHRVICLDTVFGDRYLSFASLGQYDQKRLDWLATQLETDKPILLFAHHPPMKVGFPGMDEIRMRDDAKLAALIAGSSVQHIICGHVHRTISGHWRGIGFSIFKSTCHQAPLSFESKGLSLSTDEPAAYGIVLLTEDGVIVHTEDFELASDEIVDSDDAVAQD